jgi:hypothetical protein
LTTAQNHREALLDQGGARRWTYRCVLRARPGLSSDADLYRFARGANTSAELIDPEAWPYPGPWLTLDGDQAVGHEDVLVLGAHRRENGETTIDLYNTRREAVTLTLGGPAVEGRAVHRADMLGRVQGACPGGRVRVEPLAFARVTLQA